MCFGRTCRRKRDEKENPDVRYELRESLCPRGSTARGLDGELVSARCREARPSDALADVVLSHQQRDAILAWLAPTLRRTAFAKEPISSRTHQDNLAKYLEANRGWDADFQSRP
jgi:hypothetical protein